MIKLVIEPGLFVLGIFFCFRAGHSEFAGLGVMIFGALCMSRRME